VVRRFVAAGQLRAAGPPTAPVGPARMTRQIRLLGMVLILLFLALFVNLNWIQVVHADSYAHDPRNGRIAFKQFSKARGVIQTSDGVVLARSVPVDDSFKLQRQYPEGPLFGHITGF